MPNSIQHQVFLSYHDEDEVIAEKIGRRLHDEHGVQVWLASWSVIPGTITQQAKEKGLAQSDALAILIGAQGVQGWQALDTYASIEKRIENEGSNFPVIPVYLPDCPGGIDEEIPAKLRLYEPVVFTTPDDSVAMHRLVCGINGQPPGDDTPEPDAPCPYPGLDPFREDMAQYFFGRETEIQRLEALLTVSPLAIVIGPSGSGKSSLVLAGLIPRMRGTHTTPPSYLIHTFTPGREPLHRLAMCFIPQHGDPRRDELVTAFAQDKRELRRTVQAELQQQPAHIRRILLVVDQFEEVFTLCNDDAQREAFIHNLLTVCEEIDGPAQVVLTLRSDFYTPCFDYEPLTNPERQLPVRPLTGGRLSWKVIACRHLRTDGDCGNLSSRVLTCRIEFANNISNTGNIRTGDANEKHYTNCQFCVDIVSIPSVGSTRGTSDGQRTSLYTRGIDNPAQTDSRRVLSKSLETDLASSG